MPGTPLLTRSVYAGALFVAPLFMLGAMLRDITPDADGTAELLALIAERPGAWTLGQTLFILSAIAWLPAGLGLMRLFGGRHLVGRWGGLLILLGGLAILAVDAAGLYLRPLVESDVPTEQQVSIVEGVEGSAAVIAFETVHVVGLFIGLLVVAVAMLRSRELPRLAPVALIGALIGLIVNIHPAMEAAALVLLVLGLGAAGVRVLRLSDEEWLDGAHGHRVTARKPAVS